MHDFLSPEVTSTHFMGALRILECHYAEHLFKRLIRRRALEIVDSRLWCGASRVHF